MPNIALFYSSQGALFLDQLNPDSVSMCRSRASYVIALSRALPPFTVELKSKTGVKT